MIPIALSMAEICLPVKACCAGRLGIADLFDRNSLFNHDFERCNRQALLTGFGENLAWLRGFMSERYEFWLTIAIHCD